MAETYCDLMQVIVQLHNLNVFSTFIRSLYSVHNQFNVKQKKVLQITSEPTEILILCSSVIPRLMDIKHVVLHFTQDFEMVKNEKFPIIPEKVIYIIYILIITKKKTYNFFPSNLGGGFSKKSVLNNFSSVIDRHMKLFFTRSTKLPIYVVIFMLTTGKYFPKQAKKKTGQSVKHQLKYNVQSLALENHFYTSGKIYILPIFFSSSCTLSDSLTASLDRLLVFIS